MYLRDKIDIIKIEQNSNTQEYDKNTLYRWIKADVQLRLYNIKDLNTNFSENEESNKYYVLVGKRYNLIRPWYLIRYTDDLWIDKLLKVTSLSVERFVSKQDFIEIRAKDYVNPD